MGIWHSLFGATHWQNAKMQASNIVNFEACVLPVCIFSKQTLHVYVFRSLLREVATSWELSSLRKLLWHHTINSVRWYDGFTELPCGHVGRSGTAVSFAIYSGSLLAQPIPLLQQDLHVKHPPPPTHSTCRPEWYEPLQKIEKCSILFAMKWNFI